MVVGDNSYKFYEIYKNYKGIEPEEGGDRSGSWRTPGVGWIRAGHCGVIRLVPGYHKSASCGRQGGGGATPPGSGCGGGCGGRRSATYG